MHIKDLNDGGHACTFTFKCKYVYVSKKHFFFLHSRTEFDISVCN
jgi:hypothetical protein